MSYKISKELLSEVLGQHIINYRFNGKGLFFNELLDENGLDRIGYGFIDVYELAHKCKEWAESKEWFLYPCRNFESGSKKFGCSILKPYYFDQNAHFSPSKERKFSWLLNIDEYDERDYLASTEAGAIFLACEWLLKNKDLK